MREADAGFPPNFRFVCDHLGLANTADVGAAVGQDFWLGLVAGLVGLGLVLRQCRPAHPPTSQAAVQTANSQPRASFRKATAVGKSTSSASKTFPRKHYTLHLENCKHAFAVVSNSVVTLLRCPAWSRGLAQTQCRTRTFPFTVFTSAPRCTYDMPFQKLIACPFQASGRKLLHERSHAFQGVSHACRGFFHFFGGTL